MDERCRITASDTGELSPDAICAVFAPLLADHPELAVDIVMPRNSRVDVAIKDRAGQVLARRSMSVSDRGVYASLWQQIAAELTGELTKGPQG